MKSQLPERVLRTIREHDLFRVGDTVVIGFSGGADSSALLEILVNRGFGLVAAHLNHCLRGRESDRDEEFCRSRAADYGVSFESARVEVAQLARREGLNLEDAGRRARRRFLEGVRERYGARAIALAHHADDQAETVLMRLLRGTGTTGLAGISRRNGFIVRPLLEISRPEIEVFLRLCGIPHREDSSNSDTRFLRNRIRHQLLPLLENYNPAIRANLVTTAVLCADDEDWLQESAAGQASEVLHADEKRITLLADRLLDTPPALRHRLLRQAMDRIKGDLTEIGYRHIRALEKLAASPRPNATIALPGGLTGRRCYDTLVIEPTRTEEPESGTRELVIPGPGDYRLPWGGILRVFNTDPQQDAATDSFGGIVTNPHEHPFPWVVRTFRNGDRIAPFGMPGTKKVKDLFIDAKIPAPERRRVPLVFSAGKLIWVCGLRSSCRGWKSPSPSGSFWAVYTPS